MKNSNHEIDERKNAEAAIRLSEEQLKSYIDNAGDAIYILEIATGRIQKCNARACHDLGYTEDELLKLSANNIEAVLPSREVAAIHDQVRPGEVRTIDGVHKRKDGTIFPVEIRLSSLAPAQPELMIAVVRDVTERRHAEEVLQKSEKRLREAQEMAHLGFWNWDVKTGDVEWSDEVFKIFCLDPKTFTPQIDSILALSPWPEDHQRDQELIKKAIESHNPGSYEQRFLRSDQSIGHYYSTFQGNYDEKGELISIVGTVLDITERKRGEEALRESERQISLIYDTVGDIIYNLKVEKDGNYQFTSVNQRFLTTTGLQADQIVGKRVQEIIPEPSLTLVLKKYETAIRQKEIVRWEETTEYPTGRVTGEVSVAPVFDNDMNCISLVGSVHDITERKRAEEAMNASEVRYRRLFEAAKDGILILNAETGMVVDVNPFLIEMLGYSYEQFKGKTIWELGLLKDIIANQEKFLELQKQGYVRYNDLPLETAEGQRINVEFVSNVYLVDHMKVIQCNIRNITERKRMEEKLRTSEVMYRRLFEAARDGILIVDYESGMVLDVNPFLVELLGYSREQFLGRRIWEIGFFKDIIANKLNFTELQQKGFIQYENIPLETAKGQLINAEFVSHVYQVECQNVIQCNIRDITERKQIEEKLKKNEALVQTAIENLPLIFYIIDQGGKFKLSIGAGLKGLGLKPNQVVDQSAFDIYKDFPEITSAIKKALAGEPAYFETEVSKSVFINYVVPYSIAKGEPAGLVGVALDITDRKQAEEKILGQIEELKRWQEVTLGREDRNRQLKREVNELLLRLGETVRYPSQGNDGAKDKPNDGM